MISKEKITTMLDLQDRLNFVINPVWCKANYPWHRAIMVEAVECLEHYGWKWWKKQEPDLAQARIELVDIWHFILSMKLECCTGDVAWAADSIHARFGEACVSDDHSPVEKLDALVEAAAKGYASESAFVGLMHDFGLSWDDLYTMYIAKNVLNMFRQDHGYKAGSYRKDWLGMEDNVALDQLMITKPDATPEQLYGKLEQVYANVLAQTAAA